jgi:uroporphyrin-III C-methyltransferase
LRTAKLTLVGAGPGHPDLISVRGAKALAQADAVLYDALVHPDLLNLAPEKAVKVFVGKRAGLHSFKQDDINQLILDHALQFGHVVRLKGGDPFVFARGQEEIAFVEAHGIPTEVVPGISSAIGVMGLQKIPVTRRGVSESFLVVTGTTQEGKLSADLACAANSTATIVVLMGMRQLPKITAIFRALGKDDLPVAVIQNGSLPDEQCAIGTVSTIEQLVAQQQMTAPSIIVLGEVVRYHERFEEVVGQLANEVISESANEPH